MHWEGRVNILQRQQTNPKKIKETLPFFSVAGVEGHYFGSIKVLQNNEFSPACEVSTLGSKGNHCQNLI